MSSANHLSLKNDDLTKAFMTYTLITMTSNIKKRQLIHNKFESLVKLSLEVESKPRRFGTDEHLSSKEIHLIELIGDTGERLSVTDLSVQAGVTKGAVSQALKRLENKGLSQKERDPSNRSRTIVKLTSKGKSAYFAHRHWHEQKDGGYLAYLQSLDDEKLDFLISFLTKTEDLLTAIIESDR